MTGNKSTTEPKPQPSPQSKRAKMGELLKDGFHKGELLLKHSIGLGPQPNVIPPGEALIGVEPRTVEIGWHPVGGFAGKWFAEKTGIGKLITENINKYPDPTQHWAVLVGEYCHQLWMDEQFNVIYINEQVKREEWHIFEVGKTHFNDPALRHAGETVIQDMREKRAAYNLISNNCQNFALLLLDAIKVGRHREFGTTSTIYDRLIGPGLVKDLFSDGQAQVDPDEGMPPLQHQDTVQVAQQVMDEHTTKLDTHHHTLHT